MHLPVLNDPGSLKGAEPDRREEQSMVNRTIREAVAAFSDPAHVQSAADELMVKGFDRSFLSLMPPNREIERKFGPDWRAEQIADDPATPRAGFVGSRSRSRIRGLMTGGLGYIGAAFAAGVAIASEGILPLVIAAAAAAGVGGGALGRVLSRTLGRRYDEWLHQQQERGGILLWVRTPDAEAEKTACEVLTRSGGGNVHIIERPYRPAWRRRGVSDQLAWVDKPLGEAIGR